MSPAARGAGAILLLAALAAGCVAGRIAPANLPCADARSPAGEAIDQQRQKQLAAEITRLAQAKGTALVPDLRRQLNRRQCRLTLPRPGNRELGGEEIWRQCREAVLVVGKQYRCDNCANWHVGTATGFLISADGAAVVNYHTLDKDNCGAIAAMTADGRVHAVREVLAADPAGDVAIIRLEGRGFPALPLAAANAGTGAPIFVISHPDGRFYTLTEGIVSREFARQAEGQTVELMAITADYARGSSGGPVLDRQGAVVGVVRETNSIYYREEDDRQVNLQMVIHNCVPLSALRALLR